MIAGQKQAFIAWRGTDGRYTPALRTMRNALAAVGTCLVLAAGCGGDDGEDGAADAFRAEANAICADYGPKIAAVPPPLEDPDEWAAIAGDKGDLLETAVNELRNLEPPEDLGARYDEWLELKGRSLTATRDLQMAGAAHDEELIAEALATIEEAEGEADPLAEELGLSDCAANES